MSVALSLSLSTGELAINNGAVTEGLDVIRTGQSASCLVGETTLAGLPGSISLVLFFFFSFLSHIRSVTYVSQVLLTRVVMGVEPGNETSTHVSNTGMES